MVSSKQMHLGVLSTGIGSHVSGWRLPEAVADGNERFDLIHRSVQIAERGKLDFVFFADAVNTGADAHPHMMVRLEPLTLLSALAVTTSRIGLVATVSTTYSEPYNTARALSSIDHISSGRAGWNVVTGSSPDAAANFSRGKHPPQDERYAIAEEYVGVVKGLWDSWEDGAFVGDKASGVYMDTGKMHVLNHAGPRFSVKGPLNSSRPPQGHPVIFQAGASDRGLAFAGATAEVVFATQQDQSEALAFVRKLRDATEAAGRPHDAIRVLLGVCAIVEDSEEAALATIARLGALSDPVSSMRVLSDRVGHDLSAYPLDGPLPELPPSAMMQGHAAVLTSTARRRGMTIRQLRDYAAVSSGHRVLAGTAAQVADDLESWFRCGAADGFAIMAPYAHGPLARFVDGVVPILVERGLFRAEYAGTTLREHLGLVRPAHPAMTRA